MCFNKVNIEKYLNNLLSKYINKHYKINQLSDD